MLRVQHAAAMRNSLNTNRPDVRRSLHILVNQSYCMVVAVVSQTAWKVSHWGTVICSTAPIATATGTTNVLHSLVHEQQQPVSKAGGTIMRLAGSGRHSIL
jgi:hypothetical protein